LATLSRGSKPFFGAPWRDTGPQQGAILRVPGRKKLCFSDKLFYGHKAKTMKIRLLFFLAALAIGLGTSAPAQEQKTVDPEVRQEIEA
jgi:hypothetical protein